MVHGWTECDPLLAKFSGPILGSTKVMHKVVDGVAYFNNIWLAKILGLRMLETNCYALEVHVGKNHTQEGGIILV